MTAISVSKVKFAVLVQTPFYGISWVLGVAHLRGQFVEKRVFTKGYLRPCGFSLIIEKHLFGVFM